MSFLDTWTTALRSGEYAQGCGVLKTPDNKFCCLGVAFDQLTKLYPDRYRWASDRAYAKDDRGELHQSSSALIGDLCCTLPDELREFLLRLDNEHSNAESCLTVMNDSQKADFKQIADWIDANKG